jgi:CPA1 family monovalent cation:H+ antiporter
VATSLAGVRGAITLAGVLTLPLLTPAGAPFPARELAVFLATAVILTSLVVASVGLPRLLRGLELPEGSATQLEEDRARHDAAMAAIAAIEKAQYDMLRKAADADIYTNAAAHVISLYQHRLDGDSQSGGDAAQLSKIDQAERELRLAGLQAERAEVFNLTRRSKISDELARKLVREIDLMESRFR